MDGFRVAPRSVRTRAAVRPSLRLRLRFGRTADDTVLFASCEIIISPTYNIASLTGTRRVMVREMGRPPLSRSLGALEERSKTSQSRQPAGEGTQRMNCRYFRFRRDSP